MNTALSASKLSRLLVRLDLGDRYSGLPIGECMWVPSQRVAAFEWSTEALEAGLALSPLMMPCAQGVQWARHEPFSGIHPLFSDSIPDGFGLRLMDKGLRLAGIDPAAATPLQRLAWIGGRGGGALTYEPAIDAKEDPHLISIIEAARLASSAEAENFKDIPREAIRAGGSALGARPKFWAILNADTEQVILGDAAKIPEGFTPCLLKFAPTGGDRNEPFYEAACLYLADKHGIRAAHGRLLTHPAGAALAVERFDRLPGGGKYHIQSAAALLGFDFRAPTLSYEALAKAALRIGGACEAECLYRQACFNVALSIRDDHAKNFAFIMDADGKWALSPAFDLCPSMGLGLTREHTATIQGKGERISRSDLEAFALSLGISPEIAKDGIDHARAAAAEFERMAVDLGAVRSAAREWGKRLKAIDEPLLNVLVSVDAETGHPIKRKPRNGIDLAE